MAFSPDGKTVLTGGRDRTARLWDAAYRPAHPRSLRHQAWVVAVAFSPDGRAVLTGSEDGTARLWDAASCQPIAAPLRHQSWVDAVAFSPDGKTILTGSRDKTARLWDAATGQPLGPLLWSNGPVSPVAFSPDGKTVLAGTQAAPSRLWEVADLPDDPERVALWIETITGLAVDGPDPGQALDSSALAGRRERLAKLGGPPLPPPRWSLDPFLFGTDPAERARAWAGRPALGRGRGRLRRGPPRRPLLAPLWAESARFHADRGRPDRAAEHAARAILLFWSDPELADLSLTDTAFRAESIDEIRDSSFRHLYAADVWRDRGRRRAARGDWAGAAVEFARPATPAFSLSVPDLLALAGLLRLAGDHFGSNRFADEVRSLAEHVPVIDQNGTPILDRRDCGPMLLWIALLDDPPPSALGLVRRAEGYVTKSVGEGRYVLGAALLRAGRPGEAIGRFEQSLTAQPDWPNHGLNAYGLALAHHRLGHPEEARRWLDRAERAGSRPSTGPTPPTVRASSRARRP